MRYAAALACIVDAQAALPLSRVWGDATTSSSDGPFYRSGLRGAAGAIDAKYGADSGQKIYTYISDQYAPFHSQLISATAAEAPHVLDGLLQNASSLDIHEHYTETGGATDHAFALSHLLGYRFVPRIRDLADRRLGTFEAAGRYKELEPLIGRPINTAIIHEYWDEVVRLAASLKAKTVPPSVMLKKLSAYKRQNRLDFALQEIGRIERALFTLDWLESKALPSAVNCRAEQERVSPRAGRRNLHPTQGAPDRSHRRKPGVPGLGPEPGDGRHRLLEHSIYGSCRRALTRLRPSCDRRPSGPRRTARLDAHQPHRRLSVA